MTNEEMMKQIMESPYPRYIYSAIPNGGVIITRQTDQLHTEQFLIPEESFVELVKQWKDMRRREAVNRIEIASTMPSQEIQVKRALQLIND